MSTESSEYRKPLATWVFEVWTDIDSRPHVTATETDWRSGEQTTFEHEGHLEPAILKMYRELNIPWNPVEGQA